MTEHRETEDLRPVPGGKPGVYWGAMRIALVLVVAGLIAVFVWLGVAH